MTKGSEAVKMMKCRVWVDVGRTYNYFYSSGCECPYVSNTPYPKSDDNDRYVVEFEVPEPLIKQGIVIEGKAEFSKEGD